VSEHGPEDVLHIKAMSADGLVGLSPVTQARLALSLSSNLQEHARSFFENGMKPGGVLTVGGPDGVVSQEAVDRMFEDWANQMSRASNRTGGTGPSHGIAVIAGDAKFQPIGFNADDSQFLQQRELSAKEVARIFRVPPWAIGAATGDRQTYANVVDQNRHLVTHSLRPWLVRIERAISGDVDLCPGGTYIEFELSALLRGGDDQRSQVYARALDPLTRLDDAGGGARTGESEP
jgi:HK97 family phage portal protein